LCGNGSRSVAAFVCLLRCSGGIWGLE